MRYDDGRLKECLEDLCDRLTEPAQREWVKMVDVGVVERDGAERVTKQSKRATPQSRLIRWMFAALRRAQPNAPLDHISYQGVAR